MDDAELPPTAPASDSGRDAAFVPGERYSLIERLGDGGMGTVWAAHDKLLDRTVALKVLHDRYLGAADQERLAAEARAMARLSHRNVIAVYDVAEHDGRTYLTMELVRGIHLGAWLAAEPRTWPQIVALFRGACAGLAAAHAAGIVHRDIKPANLLVGEDGELRIGDFGVAHATAARAIAPGETPTAETAGMIGTLVYMAPEQLRGQPADARSDQFALCCSLYEALHGKRPFAGDTVEDLRAAIERGCPPPERAVPRWLHAATARGLSAKPSARFPSVAALGAALRGPARRAPWIIAGGSVLVAGAIAALVVARHHGPACSDPREGFADAWNPDSRTKIAAAFARADAQLGPPSWTGLARVLDARADVLAAGHDAACRADDAERTKCVDTRSAQLRELAIALANANRDTVLHAPDIAAALPEPCVESSRAKIEALLGAGDFAAARPLVAAVQDEPAWLVPARTRLVELMLASNALEEGKQGALAIAKALADQTRAYGDAHPAHARALLLSARVHVALNRRDKARGKALEALAIMQAAFGTDAPEAAEAKQLVEELKP